MEKPNIILILIDDLGWKDLSCYGSSFYETPNIDRLAFEGMTFTNAYAAAPVCSPTRASLLTGKYPATVGLTNYIDNEPRVDTLSPNESFRARGKLIDAPFINHLPLSEDTIARRLRENGYSTWHVGKWHLGSLPFYPENHGFDVNIGGCNWGLPIYGYFSPWRIPTLEDGPKGYYLTDFLTDKATELIKNKNDKPFFLNLWYYSVHIPIQAKREITRYYKEKRRKMGLDKVKTFELGEFFPCEHKRNFRIKRRLIQSDPKYAAMIHSLDENIGRILKTLEEFGETKNTIIIFTSDNGGLATAEGSPTCNAPLAEGKGWMYEGGIREPLIIKWPGQIKEGSTCNVPITSPDFYPTILEITNTPFLETHHHEGTSFLPLLKGKTRLGKKERGIYWHFPHYGNQGGTPGSSIRRGDYKLIKFHEDNHVELYDLRKDIGETLDLSENLANIREELEQELNDWMTRVGAKLPEINPNYH
ncbi:MAG: sulfatase [Promethearchaeota archaeon]